MNSRAITLVELLIVIVVMAIIAGFTIPAVANIIENTSVKADERNAEILEDVITAAAVDGDLTIKNNKLYSNVSQRAYLGTGTWFFDDMKDYLENRVVPQSNIAQNSYIKDGSTYKFLFSVKNGNVTIFYYDSSQKAVNLNTFPLN